MIILESGDKSSDNSLARDLLRCLSWQGIQLGEWGVRTGLDCSVFISDITQAIEVIRLSVFTDMTMKVDP